MSASDVGSLIECTYITRWKKKTFCEHLTLRKHPFKIVSILFKEIKTISNIKLRHFYSMQEFTL